MRDGTKGQLLLAQLALRPPDCSLVSAQDGAADRVGKKGLQRKVLFYCNYLE